MGARCHDDLVALFLAQTIVGEDAALFGLGIGHPPARLDPLLLDQLVGREVGEIVEGADVRLAERDEHLLGEVRELGKSILDAELAALFPRSGFAALERFGRAILEFGRDILIEALDRRDFLDRNVGDFLEAGEAFGDQQLRFSLASASVRMSICEAVSWLARRKFWPRRPMARLS